MPSTEAMAWGIICGSESEASSTIYTPSRKDVLNAVATSRARRVLPMPPAPISVRRRLLMRREASVVRSCSRPTNLVRYMGRDGERAVCSGGCGVGFIIMKLLSKDPYHGHNMHARGLL